jgi:hypothetical protein
VIADMAAALRAAAVATVERGLRVFPCEAGGKRPVINRWEQRASADPEHVAAAWGSRYAGCNIGVACGPSRIVGVDLDCHGELPADWQAIPGCVDGRDVFALLLEWAGETQPPVTYWVRTPSGGWHLYFETPAAGPQVRNSAGLLGPGVDIRGRGGYLIGAGSVIGGQVYELLDDRDPAPLPAWLCRRLAPQLQPEPVVTRTAIEDEPANLRGLIEVVRQAQPGGQTDALVWAAFRLRDEIQRGRASQGDGEFLVQAGLQAGMQPETYVRYQVRHVLGGDS